MAEKVLKNEERGRGKLLAAVDHRRRERRKGQGNHLLRDEGVSVRFRVVLDRTVSGTHGPGGLGGSDGAAGWRYQATSGSIWIGEPVSSDGGSQKIEEVSGAEQTRRHAGVRVVPAERHGRGHGREQGGAELHSKCGEQFCWVVCEPKFMCDRQCQQEGFQVLRQRVSCGGRRWRAAQLQEMQQFEAGRKQGAGDKLEAMENPSRREEIPRRMVGWFRLCAASNKTMSAKSLLEDAATALRLGKSWPEEQATVCICQAFWYEERSGREERTPGRSC